MRVCAVEASGQVMIQGDRVPFLRYYSLQQGHWSRHYWAVVTGTFQLMGTIFYFGCEWSDGFIHLPETVRVWGCGRRGVRVASGRHVFLLSNRILLSTHLHIMHTTH